MALRMKIPNLIGWMWLAPIGIFQPFTCSSAMTLLLLDITIIIIISLLFYLLIYFIALIFISYLWEHLWARRKWQLTISFLDKLQSKISLTRNLLSYSRSLFEKISSKSGNEGIDRLSLWIKIHCYYQNHSKRTVLRSTLLAANAQLTSRWA